MAGIKTLGLKTTKKSKMKRNKAPWVGQPKQAKDLPDGWLWRKKKRVVGGYNNYYIQPGTNREFKSLKKAKEFLEQSLWGASEERPEDTLDASEDGQIAYEEIAKLQRQLEDAVNEKNKFETQYEEESQLYKQLMKQMEELTREKKRTETHELEGGVGRLCTAFTSFMGNMDLIMDPVKSKVNLMESSK